MNNIVLGREETYGQWSNNTEEHLRIQNSIMQEQSSWACYRFVTALRQSNIYLFGKLLTF